jgi:FKBP-type peptidyl-prolyl cis-trans isomerase
MFLRFSRSVGAVIAATTLIVSACGDSKKPGDSAAASTTSTTAATGATTTAAAAADTPPKPKVKIPATLPTKLVVTDLVVGSGPEAALGNIVTVHYVGVRSADGKEFDNSYDRGSPFPVPLGSGQVIKGWEDGLIGAKVGGQRQLDIPADLAYGDQPKGDIIKAGDALTFVVDIVSVKPGPKPPPATVTANEPKAAIVGGANVTTAVSNDLVAGTGDAVKLGDDVAVQIKAYRGDNGEQIDSTWSKPTATTLSADPTKLIPGLANGLIGMKAGGRRQVRIPFADAFGPAGNEQMKLPANTDLIVVLDLIQIG